MDLLNKPGTPIAANGLTCPFLGMERDASTSLSYPSGRNLCYQRKSFDSPRLEHQCKYCLTESYHLCPFLSGASAISLTEDVRINGPKTRHLKKKYWQIMVLALVVISVVGVFLQTKYNSIIEGPRMLQTSSAVLAGSLGDNSAVHKPTITLYASPTQSPATYTPMPPVIPLLATETIISSIHHLDMPIGTAQIFVIHQILQGESLFGMASRFNTSVEAIKNVNFNMPDPVWVDWLVVIPVDTTDVSGLPKFGAEMVVQMNASNDIILVNGDILSGIQLDTEATIDQVAAQEIALQFVADEYELEASSLTVNQPELMIFNPGLFIPDEEGSSLVWFMEVTPVELAPIREMVMVDAKSGNVIFNLNQVDTALNRITYTANNGTSRPGTLVCDESDPTCSSAGIISAQVNLCYH